MSAGIVMPSRGRGGHHGIVPRTEQQVRGQKVITVSLQQPVHLHTADNAWKPAAMKQMMAANAEHALTEVLVCVRVCVVDCALVM